MSEQVRRFRFGVQMAVGESGTAWAEQARRAEALGYDVLVMPDHVGIQLAYAPALAAAACATTHLRIGTLVLATDFRQPVTIASDAATLDLLSAGRYELGLGVGGSLLADYNFIGLPFEAPGVRVGRFTEYLDVIKQLFTEETVAYAGQHVRVDGLVGFPRPVQRPHPPILIGAGSRRMLTLGAREADIVSILPSLSTNGRFDLTELRAEALENKIGWLRQAASAHFEQLELHLVLQRFVITTDIKSAIDAIGSQWGLDAADVYASPYALIGRVEEIIGQLIARRQRFGISYYTVFDRNMEAFAPIVAALAGR